MLSQYSVGTWLQLAQQFGVVARLLQTTFDSANAREQACHAKKRDVEVDFLLTVFEGYPGHPSTSTTREPCRANVQELLMPANLGLARTAVRTELRRRQRANLVPGRLARCRGAGIGPKSYTRYN